jgi:succinyl-CoA synthetase beta subunit
MIIGVADIIPHHGAFAADITDVGHDATLLKLFNYIKILGESKRVKGSDQGPVASGQLKD